MSRQSFSGGGGGSRPASSLDFRSGVGGLSASEVAAELRSIVDLRRRNDDLARELHDVRLLLDGEKQRVRDVNRERTSALKAQREQLDREREHLIESTKQRTLRDYKEKLDREREKERTRDDDTAVRQLRRKDEEIRAVRADLAREREEHVRLAVQECEERVRDVCEQQASQQRSKLMSEMWALREQKMRVEQMLETRIEAEHERINDLRRLEEQHERDMDEAMRRSRTESVREVQKIRLAERIVQSKDEDIAYFQQVADKLHADNEKLIDEVTRLRVAESVERKVQKAIDSSPKIRRKSDVLNLSASASRSLSPGSGYNTPLGSSSPTPERREKSTSAMASKIARLEGTVKTLEEKVTSLKQENATLTQKFKSPARGPLLSRSSSSSSSTSDHDSPPADKDENATIRRLRKSTAELNSTITQLKAKIKLLEGERERSARSASVSEQRQGSQVSRRDSLHRPSSRQGTRDTARHGDAMAAAEAQVAALKEKLRSLEGLQEENIILVQHITRLTSEKMAIERRFDHQMKGALHDSESTLSLRNSEIDLLNSRIRRLEDKCRALEDGSAGSSTPLQQLTPVIGRRDQRRISEQTRSVLLSDRSDLNLHDLSTRATSPHASNCLPPETSSGASTPHQAASSPSFAVRRLSNPSTPIQARAHPVMSTLPLSGGSPGQGTDNGHLDSPSTPQGKGDASADLMRSGASSAGTPTSHLLTGDLPTALWRSHHPAAPNSAGSVATRNDGHQDNGLSCVPSQDRNIDNVISSMGSLSLSLASGTDAHSSPSSSNPRHRRSPSPNSLVSVGASLDVRPSTPPTAGVIAQPTFKLPATLSPVKLDIQKASQPSDGTCPGHDSVNLALGQVSRNGPKSPVRGRISPHHHNGFSSPSGPSTPEFDSRQQPILGYEAMFSALPASASPSPPGLRPVSDLSSESPSPPHSSSPRRIVTKVRGADSELYRAAAVAASSSFNGTGSSASPHSPLKQGSNSQVGILNNTGVA